MGLHFVEFELKPTGKDTVDPTQQDFYYNIVCLNPSLNTGLEWSKFKGVYNSLTEELPKPPRSLRFSRLPSSSSCSGIELPI